MEALCRENGGFQYDRVVLTGSIVSRNFDWESRLGPNKAVMVVRNERATKDWVVSLAAWVSRRLRYISRLDAGDSGKNPFAHTSPYLIDESIDGGHSETHNALKFERWARFISYPQLPDDLLLTVRTELQTLRQQAASILGLTADKVRVNLFAPIDGALRIVPGAFDNMTYAPEFNICIQPNHGATGRSFEAGVVCVTVKQGPYWTGNHLPGDELNKLDPNLKWVISLPVRSSRHDKVVGVVNVDGLETVPPQLQQTDGEEFKAVILALHGGMLKRFQECLDAAFRGDALPRLEA